MAGPEPSSPAAADFVVRESYGMNVLTRRGRAGAKRASRKRELTPQHDFYCHFLTDCCVMWVISPDCRPVRGEVGGPHLEIHVQMRPKWGAGGGRDLSSGVSAPSCLKCTMRSGPPDD